MQNTFRKYGLESRFSSKIPLFSKNFKANILIRWTSLELNHHMTWIFKWLQIILRSFFFIKEIRIENIEFVPLDLFWWWLFLIISLFDDTWLTISTPIMWYSDSVDILRFSLSVPAFSFYRYPVIKLFLIFFHSFVLLELHNLLCDKIICFCRFSDKIFT